MSLGLPVSRIVSVDVNLSPAGASTLNFDSLLIMGDTVGVINVQDRIRSYNTLVQVGADFGTTAPEYLAARDFFSQVPQPTQLYIGRWAQAATRGLLIGGTQTGAQQAIALWNAVVAGSFAIAVDGGAPSNVSNMNFSAAANLNAVAADIQAAIRGLGGAFANVTCVWNSVYSHFAIGSGTTGVGSAVAALTPAGVGVDISGQLLMTTGTLSETVPGINPETALAAVQIMDGLKTQWYGLTFASTHIVDADHLAIAAYIEGSGTSNPHVYGLTTAEAAALTTNDTTSIGYQLKQLGYNRTLYQFCSTDPYAIASYFGRAFTVNFDGNMTTITMMFKQEPGIAAEALTPSQASALDSNNYNYFAAFNNNTNIIVNGTVASGLFFDEVWDVDWLANAVQTAIYNALYTSATKIPQTDAGNAILGNAAASACAQGVANGTLAPGTWNAAGFGQIVQGSYLSKGFYIFVPPISSQSQSARAARQSVPIQIAAKLAGAIHDVNVSINVNQ